MEAMQDKEIREKLNSLNTLPEGYSPSLDSKWELLRAGLPEKKKQPPFSLYALAASLLLLLGFGFLFRQSATFQAEKAGIASVLPSSVAKEFTPEKAKTARPTEII